MKDVLDLSRCNKTQKKIKQSRASQVKSVFAKQTYLLLQCQMKEKPKI
jgi:hypothetical protein